MKHSYPRTLTIMIFSACAFAASAVADDDDYPVWKPSSDSAVSVTGPIMLLPDRLKAGQANFPWRLNGVIAQFKPDQGAIAARVFEVADATNPELLNGKKLCADKPVGWIVMIPAPPNGLEIDAYNSADKPTSTTSPGLCGTFTYKRW
jgi:hypothetical protein